MINTREPIKKQSWQESALLRPSCDAGNASESTESALLFSLSSQSCPDVFHLRGRGRYRSAVQNHSASTLIIFNRALLRRGGTEG